MRVPASTMIPILLLAALAPLASSGAAADQHREEQEIHREVVVIGSQPPHRRLIVDQMAKRGYLGVQLIELTPELRQHFGAPRQSGVLVSRVAGNSPAEAAGLVVGDVISAVDGKPLRTSSQLIGRIGGRREGDEIELEIWRERAPLTLRATLAESERRQVEIGQFVWRSDGESDAFVFDLDPETLEAMAAGDPQLAAKPLTVDPEAAVRVIAIDPEAVNESVGQLLERLEARGGPPGSLLMGATDREELEQRIAELEERLREMERLLRQRPRGD